MLQLTPFSVDPSPEQAEAPVKLGLKVSRDASASQFDEVFEAWNRENLLQKDGVTIYGYNEEGDGILRVDILRPNDLSIPKIAKKLGDTSLQSVVESCRQLTRSSLNQKRTLTFPRIAVMSVGDGERHYINAIPDKTSEHDLRSDRRAMGRGLNLAGAQVVSLRNIRFGLPLAVIDGEAYSYMEGRSTAFRIADIARPLLGEIEIGFGEAGYALAPKGN